MKTRSGFVSNSSTMSYLIAIHPYDWRGVQKSEVCPHCGRDITPVSADDLIDNLIKGKASIYDDDESIAEQLGNRGCSDSTILALLNSAPGCSLYFVWGDDWEIDPILDKYKDRGLITILETFFH